MRKLNLALLLLAACFAMTARAEWPERIFAPYMYLGAGDGFKLTACDDATGVKFYTLAFIIADRQQNPAWDGRDDMARGRFKDQVDAIRKRGGDVICSFGGEGGTEIALAETDAEKLVAKYQAVIDAYKFTWLDFDIEGKALERNPEASKRRNAAIAALQKKNPALLISFTLPAGARGLSQASQDLLKDAHEKGVKVRAANIMVMYFGANARRGGKTEADLCIAAANATHDQLARIDPAVGVSLCPCIGANGSQKEVFTLDDAKTLRTFADGHEWVNGITFWAVNRDGGGGAGDNSNTGTGIKQVPWDFANVFKSFTTGFKP